MKWIQSQLVQLRSTLFIPLLHVERLAKQMWKLLKGLEAWQDYCTSLHALSQGAVCQRFSNAKWSEKKFHQNKKENVHHLEISVAVETLRMS